MDNLSIAFQYFHSVSRTYVWGGSEVMTKDHGLIGECRDTVAEHDPVIPAELTNLADVGGVAGHNSFLCVGAYKSGKLKAMVP